MRKTIIEYNKRRAKINAISTKSSFGARSENVHLESGEKQNDSEPEYSPEVDFKPIVDLPLIELKTLEEDEEELLKLRARLYRYETSEEQGEWKERGTGEVKILKHKDSGVVRLLMRRDKTLKICANHYIKANMELNKHANNEKAWIWSTLADFADETPRSELLCIRFAKVEHALKFQEEFENAKQMASEYEANCADLSTKLTNVRLCENGEDSEESETNSDNDTQDNLNGK
ncbi:Ran-specific GTPase-activating protein-like protein [Leptotrombidium deliense]|uniref:Ran-specific GTPase-activating protein n=1 Tax=Leptotrombidium deliense TaxID=299467 RepID=A0A443SMY1_9ACAR|nr:Ran-specific GTPase-activating protein-like protein [Leptotrombidium deliense]